MLLDLPNVDIHTFDTLPSTQDYLLPLARLHPEKPILCITEHQTQGRGRGSKIWYAPKGATLCFSLCMRMNKSLNALNGITLAFGVVICQALQKLGVEGLRLKWPNDIYGPKGKLGGILTETHGDGPTYLIVGLGLNLDLFLEPMPTLDAPWTDIKSSAAQLIPADRLVLSLVPALLKAAEVYDGEGFEPFLEDAQTLLVNPPPFKVIDGVVFEP